MLALLALLAPVPARAQEPEPGAPPPAAGGDEAEAVSPDPDRAPGDEPGPAVEAAPIGDPGPARPPAARVTGPMLVNPTVPEPPAPPALEPEPEPEEAEAPPPAPVLADPAQLGGSLGGAWVALTTTGSADAGARVTLLAPEVGVRLRVAGPLIAAARWGLSVADTRVRGTATEAGMEVAFDEAVTRVEPGNPVLTLGGEARIGAVHLTVGLDIALPSASRSLEPLDVRSTADRLASEATHRAAAAARGWWSPWRWRPERFGVALPARLALREGRYSLAVDAALGVLVPILGDRNAEADLVLQAAVAGAVEVAGPFAVGLRLHAVGAPVGSGLPLLGSGLPDLQGGAEPFLRLDVAPATLLLGVLLNVGTTDGLGQQGPAAAVRVAGGGGF